MPVQAPRGRKQHGQAYERARFIRAAADKNATKWIKEEHKGNQSADKGKVEYFLSPGCIPPFFLGNRGEQSRTISHGCEYNRWPHNYARVYPREQTSSLRCFTIFVNSGAQSGLLLESTTALHTPALCFDWSLTDTHPSPFFLVQHDRNKNG